MALSGTPCRTSLFRGDHQGLGRLAPALPGLRSKAEHVHQLCLQPGGRVLARAGAEHVDGGGVDVGRVPSVGNLIG